MDIYAKGRGRKTKNAYQAAILYPYFEQMLPLLSDVFWQQILLELAKGYAPKFFTIHPPHTIMFCKGAANENLVLPDDIYAALPQLLSFLRQYGNIYSPIDQQQINISHSMQTPQVLDWKGIGKHGRNHLLICYFEQLKKTHNLSADILLQGNRLIQHLLCNKCISSNDVQLQDNRIVSIQGFYYNTINQQFAYDGIISNRKSKAKTKAKSKTSSTWSDLINKFERSQQNYNNFYYHLANTHGVAVIQNVHIQENNSTDNFSSDEEEEDIILSEEESEEEINDIFEETDDV